MSATATLEHLVGVSSIFESLGKVIALLDEDLVVVGASPALLGLLRTSDVEGRRLTDFIEPGPILDCLRSGRRCEGDVQTRDGRLLGACGAALIDRSMLPEARYVLCLDLDDGVDAATDSEEAERIIRALEANRWRRSAAARSLGISRATLWRRMRDFGIH